MVPNRTALKGAKEEPAMTKDSMFFIGLDLGDKNSYVVILGREGELIEEAPMASTPTAFQSSLGNWIPARWQWRWAATPGGAAK